MSKENFDCESDGGHDHIWIDDLVNGGYECVSCPAKKRVISDLMISIALLSTVDENVRFKIWLTVNYAWTLNWKKVHNRWIRTYHEMFIELQDEEWAKKEVQE